MNVLSPDWIEFKRSFVVLIEKWGNDAENVILPDFDNNDFSMNVQGAKVFPAFIKNGRIMRIEYNFSNYNLQIRQLCFSRLDKTYRLELTVK